jgi:phosphoglycolate phosphatase-like HAD superfamily hydrolase
MSLIGSLDLESTNSSSPSPNPHSERLKDVSIVMDYSGTIVNDLRPTVNAINYVLIRRSKSPVTIRQFRDEFDLPYWRILVSLGISKEEAKSKEVLSEIEYCYMLNNSQITCFPETASVIACFSSMGASLAIASSSTRLMLQSGLKRFELRDFFENLVAYEDCPKSKPAPDPLILATGSRRRFRYCFYVGDMCADVVAAHRAGMVSLSVSRKASFNSAIRLEDSETDYIARDLWQVCKIITEHVRASHLPRFREIESDVILMPQRRVALETFIA